jgi:hypothetical protein
MLRRLSDICARAAWRRRAAGSGGRPFVVPIFLAGRREKFLFGILFGRKSVSFSHPPPPPPVLRVPPDARDVAVDAPLDAQTPRRAARVLKTAKIVQVRLLNRSDKRAVSAVRRENETSSTLRRALSLDESREFNRTLQDLNLRRHCLTDHLKAV